MLDAKAHKVCYGKQIYELLKKENYGQNMTFDVIR